MKFKGVLLLIIFIPAILFAQKPNWNKVGSLAFSLAASYMEATKEQCKDNHIGSFGYHELKYGATVSYSTAGFLFGIDYMRDFHKGEKPFGKYCKRLLGLMLINWAVWEDRYSDLAGDFGTYNGWPFQGNWIKSSDVWMWDVFRLLVGAWLYLTN